MRNEFYRDSQGALLVFDTGSRTSFESLEAWLEEARGFGAPRDMVRGLQFAAGVCVLQRLSQEASAFWHKVSNGTAAKAGMRASVFDVGRLRPHPVGASGPAFGV